MTDTSKNLYIVWYPFQRRAESLSTALDLRTIYFHFGWEDRNKLFKAASYIPKFILTMRAFIRHKPKYVFIQLAPTTLLYTAALYNALTRTRYIADCHNTMIYDDHWIKWPFAKHLLRSAYLTLVHNEDVRELADRMCIKSQVLRDPLPVMQVPPDLTEIADINIAETDYVIIPWGIAADEPVSELFMAASSMPDVIFVMTWFKDRLPADLRIQAPANICFTGFLEEPVFNALYANATAALVLTMREGTQPSGAAEAISLGIPLVLSDLDTTRRLYENAPVYVQNNADSIATGVRDALENRDQLASAIKGLQEHLVEESTSQLESIKRRIVEG